VLAIDPVSPHGLSGMQTAGVFKSTMAETIGARQQRPDELGDPGLAVDPLNPATVYAGTAPAYSRARSRRHWSAINSGLTNTAIGR